MILIRGARQLVTLRGPAPPRRGNQLSDVGIIPDGALLIDGERIQQIGSTRRIENLAAARSATTIDVTGKVVLPGFADSHTRLILASLPSDPMAAPGPVLPGGAPAPPLPSARRPGSPKALRNRAAIWAQLFAAHGTTALEVRSGLRLDLAAETKALRAARALDGNPLDVSCAFLAGGATPDEPARSEADVEQVVDVLLPVIGRRRLAAFCDVECGPEAFDATQTRRILDAARALGFGLRVQGDLSDSFGIARLAVETGAASAEHLQRVTGREIDLLAASATIATLLPAWLMGRGAGGYAPARQLVDRGAAIALATGFGPASPTLSMPMVLSLACREMELSPEESITAATINGAASMGLAERLGSLEPGKQADLAVFDVRDYREIPYYFGFNLCVMTMKKGRVIYEAKAGAYSQ
ncbi:MAG: amidohydrolase family protein [Bryobacterales bacterium]